MNYGRNRGEMADINENGGHFGKKIDSGHISNVNMVIGEKTYELYFIRVWPMDTFYSHIMDRN